MRRRDVIMLVLPVPVILGSLLVGPSGGLSPADLATAALSSVGLGTSPSEEISRLAATVFFDVRLPRVLLAFLVGSALTTSGAALQALVRNPLVSPDIIGLTAGAACGAALALWLPALPLQPTAFAGGLAAAGFTYFLAARRGALPVLHIVLAGIAVTGLFTALLTMIQVAADPFQLQSIVQWTMGSLHTATWQKVGSAAPLIVIGLVALLALRWRLNVVALGDEETRAVGLSPLRERLLVLVPAALVASASVAVAGIVGMVGLAVPHIVRLLVGADHVRLIPACIAFGGCFLALVDDFSRATAASELPVGVFTTLLGLPFFATLLRGSGPAGDA